MNTHLEQFRAFADYNRRFNAQLFDVLRTLPDAERKRNQGAFFGSIHATLNHILLGDRLWLGRFRRGSLATPALQAATLLEAVASLRDELYADFDELARERAATDAALCGWTDELSQAQVEATLHYTNTQGAARAHVGWVAIAQIFNHQAHHRGQITTLLSQAGRDVGVTDFLAFALSREKTG